MDMSELYEMQREQLEIELRQNATVEDMAQTLSVAESKILDGVFNSFVTEYMREHGMIVD